MRIRSLFIMVIILFCVFGGVLGVSIYSNLKLQAFHAIQVKAGELPFSWSRFESATKELLISYDIKKSEKQWLKAYRHFTDRFDTFMAAPFTRELVTKDFDFQIFVARVNAHWDVIQNKLKQTHLQLERYLKDDRLFVENRDSGIMLVNFGENWATGEYHNPLINMIVQLRKSTSKSDSLFTDELDGISKHVEKEIRARADQIQAISVLLSALIMGIAGIFVLYHMVSTARNRKASRQYANGLSCEIEERKHTEEKLRTEQRKLRVVLDAMGEGMYIVNPRYKIEYQNTFLEKDYGARLDQTCHKKYLQYESPCPFCHIKETIESGEIRQVECALEDGRNYELIFSPFADVDGEKKAIVLWYDITKRKKIEAEVQRVGHLASIGELAAGVAHEINNPINGIISIAEIIKDHLKTDAEDTPLSDRIIREGERIARIVRNLLYFSKNRTEKQHSCHIEDILSDALGLVEKQLVRDGIELQVKPLTDLPQIHAQSQEIQQVFLNIISNARYALNQKYKEHHADKTLEISGKVINNNGRESVRVLFHDYGNGIPARLLDQICIPFFSTKPKGEGTGLGLSISHGIMVNHGGRLGFQSEVNKYTTVWVEFPLKNKGLGII